MTSVACGVPVVHAGVDWISMSCDAPSGVAALLCWRDERFAELGDQGYAEKQFTAHGYHGRSRGQVSVSTNGRAVLCQLSGAEAFDGWRAVSRYATNVSRLDVACTVRVSDGEASLASRGYSAIGGASRGRGRPIRATLISNQDRGDTLYIGSRKSDQLGRLYDKGRESKESLWKDCWRYEVQYRRDYAVSALRSLAGAPDEGAQAAASVRDWFSSRGVEPLYSAGDPAGSVAPDRKLPENERWLAWARRCVRPRAMELAKVYGWRFVAELLVGPIKTYDAWESLVGGIEIELVEDI